MLRTIIQKLNSEDAELTWLESVLVAVVFTVLAFVLCVIVQALLDALNLPEWMFIHHDCPNPKGVCL